MKHVFLPSAFGFSFPRRSISMDFVPYGQVLRPQNSGVSNGGSGSSIGSRSQERLGRFFPLAPPRNLSNCNLFMQEAMI